MTLIEIMIVVVIMAMISAAVGLAVVRAKNDADLRLARTALRTLANVAATYQITRGSSSDCPTLQQLESSKLLAAGSNTQDPWGTPYELSCETGDIDVRTAGPDRERGTSDDMALLKAEPE
jgi:type II secretory pathway pseudopilin PulG